MPEDDSTTPAPDGAKATGTTPTSAKAADRAPADRKAEKRRSWLSRLSAAISGEPDNQEDLVELLRDVQAGVDIIDRLRGRVSGLGVPQLVVDLPGGGGKVTLVPERLVRREGAHMVFRNGQGREFTYVDSPLPET